MPKISCVDPNNLVEYEVEIPNALKEESKAKPIVDEMISLNLGDEKDHKLV